MVQFVAALRCAVVPRSSRLARAVELVERHRSLRLEFVDAVLGAVSEELRIDELASLDRESLAVRRPGRPRFVVNPPPRAGRRRRRQPWHRGRRLR